MKLKDEFIKFCPYCGSTDIKRMNGMYECLNCPTDGTCTFKEPEICRRED